MTTSVEIKGWIDEASSAGATHLIVVCDTFDHEDYPVLVMPGEIPREKRKGLGEMQRAMECYDLSMNIESQLSERRAQNWEVSKTLPKAASTTSLDNEAKRIRPSWDQYFLAMAEVVARRATCDRKHVGAIIVDERHRIVSTGYNGSAKGMPHCDDDGHLLKEIDGRESCIRTLHAEDNALGDAGRRADKGTIYVTVIPCYNCAKRIVNAGIQRVVWSEYYPSQNTTLVIDFFKEAGVDFMTREGIS